MDKIIFPNLQKIILQDKKVDFIIIGEIHGISENALIIKKILDEILNNDKDKKNVLTFEWLLKKNEIRGLKNFISGKINNVYTPKFFFD